MFEEKLEKKEKKNMAFNPQGKRERINCALGVSFFLTFLTPDKVTENLLSENIGKGK